MNVEFFIQVSPLWSPGFSRIRLARQYATPGKHPTGE
jgi:hypothetical protein